MRWSLPSHRRTAARKALPCRTFAPALCRCTEHRREDYFSTAISGPRASPALPLRGALRGVNSRLTRRVLFLLQSLACADRANYVAHNSFRCQAYFSRNLCPAKQKSRNKQSNIDHILDKVIETYDATRKSVSLTVTTFAKRCGAEAFDGMVGSRETTGHDPRPGKTISWSTPPR